MIKATSKEWNAQLPYEIEENWLESIRNDLALVVQSHNSIGITEVTSNLKLYLELKLEISASDLAWFSNIFYSVVTESNSVTSSSYCELFVQLAQDEHDLPSDYLQLDWKPVYDLLYKYIYPQHGRSYSSNAGSLSSIVKMAKQAARFFKPEATMEILGLILPFLNLHDSSSFCSYMGLLTLLLPVHHLPMDSNGKKTTFYWVPILMKLWSCCGNSSTIDMMFFDIFGRLFKYHGSHPERICLNSDDMAFIFCRGARMIGLTVGSGTSGIEAKHLSRKGLSESGVMDLGMPLGSYFHTSKTSSFAKIIVYSLPSVSNNPSTDTITHLESFFRAVEPFAHPSNSGKWSSSIAKLSSEISQTLHERCIQDATSTANPPLSAVTIDIVTRLVSNIVQMMVFGKDSSSVSSSQSAIKFLAWVHPDAIIPSFLTAAYPSLQGLSETHRTVSALGTLYSIATPLIRRSHFPAGGSSVISLLYLIIPGLDVNDIAKSISTLIFIFAVVSNVPLVNSSMFPLTESCYNDDTTHSIRSSVDDDSCRQSTAEFEAWLAMFMDRIFVILDNLPQNYGVGDNVTIEGNLLETIYFTCHIVFSQLSSDLEDMVLRMLVKKARTSLIPTATEAIGSLCGIIASSNPQKRLALFVPLCIDAIKLEIENGAGSISSGNRFVANPNPFDFASMSDTSLHWYQSILMKVVANSGPSLLQYREGLLDIIALMANKCVSKRGYLWTGQLISSILGSLSGIYPNDFRSHSPKDWNDPEFPMRSYQLWGKFCKVVDLRITWHIPSSEEREFAFDIATHYVKLCLSKIEYLMASPNSASTSSSEFSRWLSILTNCLMGATTFLQPLKNTRNHGSHGDFSDIYSPSRLNLHLNAGFLFEFGEEKHTQWADMIAQTQDLFMRMLDFFTLHRTDDIESVKALLHCIKSHLSYWSIYDSASWIYSYSKTILKAGKDETVLPRSILISRVYMLHLRRVQEIIKSTPTSRPIYMLICRLLDFSLSKYAEIRKTAQSSLFSALRYHRSLRFDITYKTLQVLKESGDKRDSDRIKGALYVLKDRFSIMGVYVYYWEFTALFIDAILFNNTEEKPSILEIIRKLALEFSALFLPGDLTERISSSASLAMETAVDSARLEQYSAIKTFLDERARKAIDSTTICILSYLSGNLNVNWRFEAMALHFLDMIVPKSPISPQMIQAIFLRFFEPNPTIRTNCQSVLAHMIDIIKDDIIHSSPTIACKSIVKKGSHIYPEILKKMCEFGETSGSETYFVDKSVGWLIFPESFKVYVSNKEGDYVSFESKETGRLLVEGIQAESFWDQLLFFAGEESSKEQFKSSNADFYKRLFLIIQDSCFEMILARIDQLVVKTQENNSQRLASELVAGIIRGSKHWSTEKKKRVENDVFPLLFKGIQSATMESIRHWLACVRYVLSRRDPSRLAPIIDYIIDTPLDLESTSFLSESKKLWLKDLVLQTCSFRVRFHVKKILSQLTAYVATPFQQVRDAFGRCFDDCLQLLWSERFNTLEDLLVASRFEPTELPINSHIKIISGQLLEWKNLPYKLGAPSIYGNACKSVLAWFGYALTSYQVPGISNSFPLMLPLILEMQDFPDSDLASMAAQILKIYPNFLHSSVQLDLIVDILIDLCLPPLRDVVSDESKSWHLKARVLPILQVFYFRHIYCLSKKAKGKIMELLDNLIGDQQVEVRRLASITLSGIVQCSEKKSIDVLISRYQGYLSSNKLPRRKRNDPIPDGYSKTLHQRHSSVLGLSSLVLAFPYELPEWMPRVLVSLAGCASDPSPISNSISHVFGEFKRTHQDSWEKDKEQFSSEDLYIVTDLIYSSSYFA